MITSKSKILFMMTGSIACYKACNTISKLVQAGADVQVVASASALKFVGASTLEGLSGKPVPSDLWTSGQAMDHIHLIRSADLILMAPASANSINKMAHGVGDDLITTLFLAHDFKKPFLVTPAMNTAMYNHPATQTSLSLLKNMGIEILETASGVLACGEVGYGKLLDPELIFGEVVKALDKKLELPAPLFVNHKPVKVLITSGGTQEPIDDVRVLTNRSTGATGARLAERLFDLGLDVTLLCSASAKIPQRDLQTKSFVTFQDLAAKLQETLQNENYDVVIHAAAVSDFSLENPIVGGKLSSDEPLNLRFKKNPKLVNDIKAWSRGATLVAFKMTSTTDSRAQDMAVEKLFRESQADAVVHNDVSEISLNSGQHTFSLHLPTSRAAHRVTIANAEQLAEMLFEDVIKTKELQ